MRSQSTKAQTVIELSIFGAIIIFMIGVIVRQAMGFGMQQNQSLKAMRTAMMLSKSYSQQNGVTSHNSATVLIVEDRLSLSADKYGPIDRVPYIVGGRGSYTNQMFQRVIVGENYNLPVYDIFINGVYIPFQVAAFRVLGGSSEGAIPLDNTNPDWEDECLLITPQDGIVCNMGQCSKLCEQGSFPGACGHSCDESSCTCDNQCDKPSSPPYNEGCVTMYSTVLNNPQSKDWCTTDCISSGTPPGCCDTTKNLSSDERFDLDRDGIPDVPQADRPAFAWQWKKVYAVYEDVLHPWATFVDGEGIHFQNGKNISIDVDVDFKEERVLGMLSNYAGVITRLDVMDSQNGDLDLTYDTADYNAYMAGPQAPGVKPQPGMLDGTSIYTFIPVGNSPGEGTYMLIEEGKLFTLDGDEKQYIRNVSKKDSIDYVERVIQLSNDTNRFCDANGNPTATMPENINIKNPVEACNNCVSGVNIEKTCLDEGSMLLFVRSRIKDLHGRKWVTETGSDPYVDIQTPPLP